MYCLNFVHFYCFWALFLFIVIVRGSLLFFTWFIFGFCYSSLLFFALFNVIVTGGGGDEGGTPVEEAQEGVRGTGKLAFDSSHASKDASISRLE
jgi:energy-coupling factor transporter transmembrane protein EcfT